MRQPPLLIALLIALGSAIGGAGQAADRPANPNVLLLLTDDLGWQDVKCYDIDDPSPTETPNIDALASRGVKFWQAYSPTPVCSSTRCAIMSGNHPARAQKTNIRGGVPPQPRVPRVRMIDPWYSGRMPADELTIARALKSHGYTTGHVGKWHIAINHHAFPQPKDVGFDFSWSSLGATRRMPDRLTGFATDKPGDPFRLDKNGYAYHQTTEDALGFLRDHKADPFFLYYCTWLVHAPIHTRSEALLQKYAERIGTDPASVPGLERTGYTNPFYCAMVEELDYHVGRVFDYLRDTDDPRWPGHKLVENTYVFFTSDNGGMEGPMRERYTENYPLDRGKISAMEGGVRVPLIVTGPGVPTGVETDVMANGLDFYPTILSLAGLPRPEGKNLDGCDLEPLLHGDPTDATLVRDREGQPRDTLMWHFPHGVALESTIRVGDYKLIRNYDHVQNPRATELELYRLYDSSGGKQRRVDIEESNNLAEALPAKTAELNQKLTAMLSEMKAAFPSYNPGTNARLPGKADICTDISHEQQAGMLRVRFRQNGAAVVRADLIYTLNGGGRYEEWFRQPMRLVSDTEAEVEVPDGATHAYVNLTDENNFLVSYPGFPEARWDAKSFVAGSIALAAP